MTEIDGKKYYTWNEIVAMPLGTKFKLEGWLKEFWLVREKGVIGAFFSLEKPCTGNWHLSYQDRFEIVEKVKPEREYVDGPDALRKLMNGEWENIACDDADWLENVKWLLVKQIPKEYEGLKEFYLGSKGSFGLDAALSPDFLKLKLWYEYKD